MICTLGLDKGTDGNNGTWCQLDSHHHDAMFLFCSGQTDGQAAKQPRNTPFRPSPQIYYIICPKLIPKANKFTMATNTRVILR